MPTCRKKTLKKQKNLSEQSQDEKTIPPILLLYYEQSVCPLILNYKKVQLASSLTCQTYFISLILHKQYYQEM